MYIIKRLLAILILVSLSYGQKTYFSAGLIAQFGSGLQPSIEIGDTTRESYVYREHFLDVTAAYGNFILWSNFEFSSPPRIGPDHLGLRKLRLTWESDRLSVNAGDLYGQFGRGLALNLWENQGIDWDSSLKGIWLTARPTDKLSVDIVSGNTAGGRHLPIGPGVDTRIRDFSEDVTVSALLFTANDLLPNLSVGFYGVDVDADNPWFWKMQSLFGGVETVDSISVRTRSFSPGLFVEYFGPNFDVYMEMMKRSLEIFDADSLYSTPLYDWLYYDKESKGWGGYASVSYYPGKLGVTLEYKNYFFDTSHPDKREHLPYRLGRLAPMMNGPTAFKEHSSILLGRVPHVMDFEDEVGIQAEINLNVTDNLFLIFNYAQSSRHTMFKRITDIDWISNWEKDYLPFGGWHSSDEGFYPFSEAYGEVDYYYESLNLNFNVIIARSKEVLEYEYDIIEKAADVEYLDKHIINWEKRNVWSIPIQLTLALPAEYGLTVYFEHQWEDIETGTHIFSTDTLSGELAEALSEDQTSDPNYNRYVALSLGKSSQYSIGLVYDFASETPTGVKENTDPENDSWLEEMLRNSGVDLTNKWFGVQGSLYLTPATILSVFYGSLQGGLKCESGVCVYVPGIEDAFTVTITSNF